MNLDPKCPLLVKPNAGEGVYQEITPKGAGWDFLHFSARRMTKRETWRADTGSHEFCIVLLSGNVSLESSRGAWKTVQGRHDVFHGLPHAFYLPPNTSFSLTPTTETADVACGYCEAEGGLPARMITPQDVHCYGIEIRGGDNATRQIDSILPPGAACRRLVCVEVYTPSGNWSSFPAHKHDVRKVAEDGRLVEACLEEIYFYKFDRPQGFGMQRVYTDDKTLNEIALVANDDAVLVKRGYHPFVAGHGYNAYYLNFLAGSDQALNASMDPDHAWINGTWKGRDPRVPMVGLRLNEHGGGDDGKEV